MPFQHFPGFLITGPIRGYFHILPKFSCGCKVMNICLSNACVKLAMLQVSSVISNISEKMKQPECKQFSARAFTSPVFY